jgi:glycosyltransferase involved in cell wall biosynthesis
LTAPVYPWDAVICTSTAVKDNVQRLLQAQVDFLRDRLKLQQVVLPKFPVIPLGIHCADFEHREADRVTSRSELGIAPDEIVVLFMGRLSFHAKAHPLAMYQALQKASQNSRKRVVLIECGWHANNHIQSAYTEAARVACPSVPIKILDGRLADQRALAWAAADIFCSLSDNIQETFGITPIEAMAAGLPVVVSDWDGYRDTVRDRSDGFRIPTAPQI